MSGWCPGCGRKLANLQRNGKGSCREHGHVWAEWEVPKMVVDLQDEVLGFFAGLDTDTFDVAVRTFGGETRYERPDVVEVLPSSEIQDGDW